MTGSILSPNPLIRLTSTPRFRAKTRPKAPAVSARLDDSKNSANQQLNLSVLRFTLGISLSLSLSRHFLMQLENLGLWEAVKTLCVTFRCNLGFRDSWIGRVLLTQMDRLWIWFTSSPEPLFWFEFSCSHHPSAVSKHTQFWETPLFSDSRWVSIISAIWCDFNCS